MLLGMIAHFFMCRLENFCALKAATRKVLGFCASGLGHGGIVPDSSSDILREQEF